MQLVRLRSGFRPEASVLYRWSDATWWTETASFGLRAPHVVGAGTPPVLCLPSRGYSVRLANMCWLKGHVGGDSPDFADSSLSSILTVKRANTVLGGSAMRRRLRHLPCAVLSQVRRLVPSSLPPHGPSLIRSSFDTYGQRTATCFVREAWSDDRCRLDGEADPQFPVEKSGL